MQSQFQLIALDIDGTILPKNKQISIETKRLIAQAKASGIEVTFATGRHFSAICETFAKELNISVPLVTLNGGEVRTPDGILLRSSPFSLENMIFLSNLANELQVEFLAFTNEGLFMKDQFPSNFSVHTWLKFVYFSKDKDTLNQLWTELSHQGEFTLSQSDPFNIEVNPLGVTKAIGLAVVCSELGISRSQVIAIGDGLNDVEAISWAGLGIAMGQAPLAVQQAADFVTDTCENDGVAKAIEKILLNQNMKKHKRLSHVTLDEIRRAEKEYHDDCYHHFNLFEEGSWLSKPAQSVLDIIPLLNGKGPLRGLDLGCGVGRNSIPLALLLKSTGGTIVCVDLLESALTKLHEYSERYGVQNVIDAVQADIGDFRIEPNSFDFIIAVSSLEHVQSTEIFDRILNSMKQGIRENGILCVIINSEEEESDAITHEKLDSYVEVNMSTSDTLRKLGDAFQNWSILKCEVKPLEFAIARRDRSVILRTNAVSYVAQRK